MSFNMSKSLSRQRYYAWDMRINTMFTHRIGGRLGSVNSGLHRVVRGIPPVHCTQRYSGDNQAILESLTSESPSAVTQAMSGVRCEKSRMRDENDQTDYKSDEE